MEKKFERISLKLHKENDKDILELIKANKQGSIKEIIRKGGKIMDIEKLFQKQIDVLQAEIEELQADKERLQKVITDLCYEKGVLKGQISMLEIENKSLKGE